MANTQPKPKAKTKDAEEGMEEEGLGEGGDAAAEPAQEHEEVNLKT